MLKPEVSIPVAVSTASLVYGIFAISLPNVAEARTSAVDDDDLRAAENVAMWTSIAAVAAIALTTRQTLPLIYGGGMAVGLAWLHRWARVVDPATGRINVSASLRYMTGDE